MDSSMIKNNKYMINFIESYKKCRLLWDKKDKNHTNHSERRKAHQILLEKYKLIDPNANIDTVKTRIDQMRCSFRRERNKVLKSREAGDEHLPVLWYYKYFLFLLGDDDTDNESTYEPVSVEPVNVSMNEEEEESLEVEYLEDFENITHAPEQVFIDNYREEPCKRKKIQIIKQNEVDNPLNESREMVKARTEGESQCMVFAKALGMQLEELATNQQHIAQKLISDIVFYGRMRQLNVNSVVLLNNTNNTNNPSTPLKSQLEQLLSNT